MSEFEKLNLNPLILKAILEKGYKNPSPIQAQAVPSLMQGRDLIGIAQTGTGKTAAFSWPLLHRLVSREVKRRPARVRALILTPTRELATQIDESLKSYGKNLKIKTAVVFGGVGHQKQIQKLSKGLDVLVATPGRLLDLMNEGHVLYEDLEVFILDEADRMLDMGFIKDIKKVIAVLPKNKQTLLFSATMPKDISELAKGLLKNPVRVEVTPESTTVDKIDQLVYSIEKAHKPYLLEKILKQKRSNSTLVFTRTKHGADKVVKILSTRFGIESAAIHGNKSQSARERALGGFKDGSIKVLVATDIAARGIDVSKVGLVVNYDLPDDPKSYVHRIGRTARAGREGSAISFCSEEEKKLLKDIEKQIKTAIPFGEKVSFENIPLPKQIERSMGQKKKSSSQRPGNKKRSSKTGGAKRR